jgi:hypothetical protein
MVDALSTIRDWLAPNGLLIDIHPTGEPPPITVRVDRTEHPAGWLRELGDDEKYLSATQALEDAVRQRLFSWETRSTFTFTYEADTLTDLQQFLADKWQDAVLDGVVCGQITALMSVVSAENTPNTIFLREAISLAALTPQHPGNS